MHSATPIDTFPHATDSEASQTSESMTGSDMSGFSPTERHILLQRISRQLVELDREGESTESISRKRLELRRLWNTALLIHTLPCELLTRIFANIQTDPQSSHLEPSLHAATGERHGARPVTDWHGLMLVCSYWRNLLVSNPVFWRIVDTKRHIEWTKLCFHRSAAASLQVRANVRDQSTLNMLYPQVHRFQKLLFSAPRLSKWQIQAALPPLFSGGMPLLEHLDFCTSVKPSVDLGSYLTSHQFPHLQTLVLERVVSPKDRPLYAQLRTLSLFRCSHSVSFDGFLDALAECGQLEELTLKDTLHTLSGEWTRRRTVPHRQPITLASLRQFSLHERGIGLIPHFLAHLHIPASTSLLVTSDFPPNGDGGGSPDTMKALGTLLPPNRSKTLPILSTATRIVMRFMRDQWFTMAHDQYPSGTAGPSSSRQEPSPTMFTLYSNPDGFGQEPAWTAQGLEDLVECFGGSPLTLLEVYEDHSYTSTIGWERVFRTFSLLEELIVHSETTHMELSKVFLALHAVSSGAREDPSVACMNLKQVSVRGWGTAATFEAMRECFRRRADGGARLEVLNLRNLYNGRDLTSEERCGFVEDLRRQVVCVEDN